MHSYQWTVGDTALALAPAWPFAIGYAVMSVTFFAARWITEEGGNHT
jgi:AGZA family xanthine/uracil permease-like MFS transporter